MPCALCHADAELCNSHILPEFLYRALYDDKHRFHQISAHPDARNRVIQKGLRERLLCHACEQRLSVYEQYADRLLNGGVGVSVRRDGERLYLQQVDYAKLKLFQLSILWRAGVSTLSAFSQVQLGPHGERLRQQLVAEDPGPPELYGCLMFILMHESEVQPGMVVPPTWAKFVGQRAYRFVFGGTVYLYLVSSTPPPTYVSEHFVQPSGTATVRLQQLQEMHFLVDTLAKMHSLSKFAV